jgi:hypothetical protein
MSPARRNLYALAERLGMLVADLEARMTLREFLGWIEYVQPVEAPLAEPTPENVLAAFGGGAP